MRIDSNADRQHAASVRPYSRIGDTTHPNTAVVYQCPLCRATTTVSWRRRPVNHALNSILMDHPSYAERALAQVDSVRSELVSTTSGNADTEADTEANTEAHTEADTEADTVADPGTTAASAQRMTSARVSLLSACRTNLRSLAESNRRQIAESLYLRILPELHAAACDGKSSITFTSSDTVMAAQQVLDTLSSKLFSWHGCYRVEMNRTFTSLTVHFTDIHLDRCYTNENYTYPDDAHESIAPSPTSRSVPPPPPPTRPLTRNETLLPRDAAMEASRTRTERLARMARMLTRREQLHLRRSSSPTGNN